MNHPRTRSRVRTVAERNNVSEATIWRLIRKGKLTAYRVGARITLVDDEEVEQLFGRVSKAAA